jgi:thymidylate kinase
MSRIVPTPSGTYDDVLVSGFTEAASPRSPDADTPRFKGLNPNISVIAVTGGPCAGKSSGMAMLQRRLTERGFKVFVVPEVATILINGGLIFNDVVSKQLFQRQVLLEQLHMEDMFMQAAAKYGNAGHRVVILCDRGAMDGRAYQSQEEWLQLLSESGLNEQMICEHRYTGVVHLRTCADGASASFTLDNNPARAAARVTPEEALELDRKTAVAWQRHPSQRFIENMGVTWPQKLQTLLDKVLLLVEPGTVSAFAVHKFVIEGIDENVLRSHVQSVMVVRILENLLLPGVYSTISQPLSQYFFFVPSFAACLNSSCEP